MADHPFRRIFEDEHFKAVLAEIKGDVLRAFSNTKPEEQSSRETAYYDIQAIARLENRLRALAEGEALDDRKRAKK